MTLIQIGFFIIISLIIRFSSQKVDKSWMIMVFSLVSIYWLQTVSPIRSLEFWLPTLFICMSLLTWGIISPKELFQKKKNLLSIGIALFLIILIGLLRYLNISELSKYINPPEIRGVLLLLVPVTIILWLLGKSQDPQKTLALPSIILLISLLILLKYPPFSEKVSYLLRKINGQSLALVNAREIVWVGYSYFAFRLIHVWREWQQGRKIEVDLNTFIAYVLFFPAVAAGPIDRLDHFMKEVERPGSDPVNDDILRGGQRIVKGLFYKFILADNLALVAFNAVTINQIRQPYWMWLVVYAYAFRIYFDFSGYTDLAIGISKIMGIQLPENFDHPYLSRNISLFWNRWHMSLTKWFQTYYFNPVTRCLRTSKKYISAGVIIIFTQMTTMLLIGLWHGISLNFILWGVWNGIGLFIHNRWSDWMNKMNLHFESANWKNRISTILSVFLTFNYVALGWVWFALPTVQDSLSTFSKLFGWGS